MEKDIVLNKDILRKPEQKSDLPTACTINAFTGGGTIKYNFMNSRFDFAQ